MAEGGTDGIMRASRSEGILGPEEDFDQSVHALSRRLVGEIEQDDLLGVELANVPAVFRCGLAAGQAG